MKHLDPLLGTLCVLTLLLALTACTAASPELEPTASPAPIPTETPVPSIEPEHSSLPESETGTELSYSADGLYVSVTLPAGWAGRFDGSDEGFPCAQVWMEEAPSETVRFWCAQQPVGLCGTGVTFGKITLEDGRTVTTAQETIDDSQWFCWMVEDGDVQFCVDGSLSAERFEAMRAGLAALLGRASAQPDD